MTPEITVQFKKAWKLIEKSEKIFLTTHERTDGDDLGSLLAMLHTLRQKGKQVSAAVKGGVPEVLKYLPKTNLVADQMPQESFDLAVIFGCSNIKRPGFKQIESWKIPIINFDHHPDNTGFGEVNVVDPQTAAVAELVYYFLQSGGIKIDRDIATCLLTGIFTDTGGFKHPNTTASALQVAGELMKKGARVDKIASNVMSKKKPQALKAWARALENTRFDAHKKLLFSVITEEDMKAMQATADDLDGFVEFLNHIPEAKFVMVLRQDGEVVRGNLRSDIGKNVDVSRIAKAFGGGGHKLASGFKVKGRLVKDRNTWKIVAT